MKRKLSMSAKDDEKFVRITIEFKSFNWSTRPEDENDIASQRVERKFQELVDSVHATMRERFYVTNIRWGDEIVEGG